MLHWGHCLVPSGGPVTHTGKPGKGKCGVVNAAGGPSMGVINPCKPGGALGLAESTQHLSLSLGAMQSAALSISCPIGKFRGGMTGWHLNVVILFHSVPLFCLHIQILKGGVYLPYTGCRRIAYLHPGRLPDAEISASHSTLTPRPEVR